MELEVSGTCIEWRGPSPFFFLPLDAESADAVAARAGALSYGWGCIPITARIGETRFTTSLIPREGTYLLPLKKAVRDPEAIDLDTKVRATIMLA